MNKKEKQLIFFIIFLTLGFLLALQFRSILFANKQKASSAINVDLLQKKLDDELRTSKLYKEEIERLQKAKEDFLKAPVEGSYYSEELEMLRRQLDTVELMAGFKEVKGAGIVIKLNDALEAREGPVRDYMVHDADIVKILNELRDAGAQAIAINGERIISTSGQVCTGPTIKINNNRYAVPYEIKAIGDSETMIRNLDESEIVLDLRRYNIRLDISTEKEIVIPEFKNQLENLLSGLEVIEDENK
jgi:uncharacterized protein YlxW (UPF0749 family)